MVRRHYVSGEVGNVSVQIDDVNLMMLLKLAKSGYGSINELLQTRSDLVVKAYQVCCNLWYSVRRNVY